MMKRVLLLALICVLFVFSNVAQATPKRLNQLKQQLAASKSLSDELAAKIELIDYFAHEDPRKWKHEICQLQSTRSRYPEKTAQQKISVIYAEYLVKSGNLDQFKSIFSKQLATVSFSNKDFAFRYHRVRFEYELMYEKWSQAKETADSSLRFIEKRRNNAQASLIYQDFSRL